LPEPRAGPGAGSIMEIESSLGRASFPQTYERVPMSTTQDIPFVRASGFEKPGGGFETTGAAPKVAPPPKPAKDAPPSPRQKARANDLFLRGALTPEELARAKANRGGFEAVIGRSNFLPAVFLEIGVAASRSTCLVRTSGVDYQGRPGSWSGTGFLLSANVLVTNHHVLNSAEVAAAANCVFNYQVGADGRPLPTRTFRLRPDRLFLTSPTVGGLDYTFVWVDGDPGRDFGAARVSRQAFAIAESEFANVISHPAGRMKEVALQENEVQWQDELVVHYTSDTEPGSSGASVCNNNWQLVALHHASKPSNVPNYPILNEGIKLSAIAADLERLTRAGGSSADAARAVLALFGGTDERLGFFGTLGRRPQGRATGPEAVVDTYKGTEQDVDVGFWNVEWLTKTYETKTPAVAKVIHALNLDIWCLEESSPNAAEALAKELRDTYGLNFEWAAAEPELEDGKQSCTLLWNADTVSCKPEAWGEPIETWLRTRSRDFDDLDLGLEAVHGKIFDRYPAAFYFATKQPVNGKPFSFYLVPVHLKAMDEGSLRRRMASKILAAAIRRKIDEGKVADWIIGGDFNAELSTHDFDDLVTGKMVPVSAEDEQNGAFSYIKGPQSLIDHIFLSPNLAKRYGATDYFIVAADRTFPDYVDEISDHRPVLLRMSLNGTGEPERAGFESTRNGKASAALAELKKLLGSARPTPAKVEMPPGEAVEIDEGFERARRPQDYRNRPGYDPDFLGGGGRRVPLPGLPEALAEKAVTVDNEARGIEQFILPYTHFSVVMNGERRMPFYSAVNIDGTDLRRIPRGGERWKFDPRIPQEVQAGNPVYKNTDLDRGHMTRRIDPVWGARRLASVADDDTFHFTNACPQHKDLNQREWQQLEDYVLDNAGAEGLKVCVFTGPVFGRKDKEFREIRLPEEFWKVVVMVRSDTRRLSATGYILSQSDMITGLEAVYGAFKTYQVPLKRIEHLTGLDLGRLPDFDPFPGPRPGAGGFEGLGGPEAKLIAGPQDLVF
jgi:DNA/RNA endonuclease G (NUC1)